MTGSPIYQAAHRVASLVSRREQPTPFGKRLQYELELEEIAPDSGAFLDLLRSLEGNDPLLNELGRGLHKWDAVPKQEGADWVGGTEPCTEDRRALIYRLLGLTSEEGQVLLNKRPVFVSGTTVISAENWDPWYTDNVAAGRDFYWRHYERYLLEAKDWPQRSVSSVDQATTRVMERLTNPTRPEAYQSKGLVVGYVQSGKTANFTGVIAKAIDAGYRLVIVMTGTLELLRGQTQRRVDMELVGKKNIVGDLPEDQRPDYLDDSDWESFSVFDEEPETSIVRLTERTRDYRRGQFQRLQFEWPIREKPLFDKDNLFRINARLAVVKKNKNVLTHLVNDIRANKNAFAEIPVLIIDDEADQASVNTVNPAKVRKAKKEGKDVAMRKAINKCVAQMLELMPRAQYVGYTATPFANVFTDPSDEQGIYPKDFVIGLDRPPGYMGVEDFHDLEEAEMQSGISNEKAHVRPLRASPEPEHAGERAKELARALDSFVLAGAVKLWRESQGMKFRHHTMLIHEAVGTQEHAELAELVRDTWRDGGYTTAAGAERLGDLYEEDVLAVSRERCEEGVPKPPAWTELRKFVGKAVGRITEFDGNPVLVVNSDRDIQQHQQELNFDAHRVWRILIGGAKLSRGFTVEGLTVTYFRRATDLSDSLTQMGRWFGFRHGYRDLIRLYIARNVRKGRRDIDLYKAFEGIAQAENDFRAQLKSYARLGPDGRPYVTPKQVPCLVRQYLPWLQPTARNKMFNAKLKGEMKQPFLPTGLGQGAAHNKHNLEIWQELLSGIGEPIELPQGDGGTFRARVASVSAADFIDSIEKLHYVGGYTESTVRPAVFAYRKALEEGSIDNFLLVLPQPATTQVAVEGLEPLATISRKRSRGPLFQNIDDPKHRAVVDDFVRGKPASVLASFHSAKAGAVLVYLINESGSVSARAAGGITSWPKDGHVFAYSAYVPQRVASGPAGIPTFSVHTETQGDAVTVDASGAL